MSFGEKVVALLIFIFVASSPGAFTARDSIDCDRECGRRGGSPRRVPYPFGFSNACGIRLNCSEEGDIRIGEFRVHNVTSDNILVNLPANCSRPIDEIKQFFGRNYAPTWRNSLLVQNCSSELHGCVVRTDFIKSRFQINGCESREDDIRCYSEKNRDTEFIDENSIQERCRVLFSSVAVDFHNNTDTNSALALEFQTVELGWWLDGNCKCDDHADCTPVRSSSGTQGFRCRCKEGFEGDGFPVGDGCRKVSNCNAYKYMSGRCKGASKVGVLIGGIIVGASLMGIIVLTCYFIRRHSSTNSKHRMSANRLLCEAAGSSSVPMFPYKEIERATNWFSEKHRLGTGAYGTVYAGKLYNNDWVAVKKIRHRDIDGIEQVLNEIRLLSSVSHPNLVRLLGCCIENDEQILVYEFMPNGTLSQHLQREWGKCLPWTIRLKIATETAHAIAHLHSALNPPIYHRDIKSSNILLDYNFNSKVADFGLSRLGMIDDSHISTAPQGTPGYVDPQYHQNYHLSDKSDVYSFGVVLVEIITALKVVDFSRPHSEINLAALAVDRIAKGRVDEIIDQFLEPHRDAWTLSSVHKMAELAFRCLAFDRDTRPSMMEVADELEQIRLSGWAPMEDNICAASSVSSCCSSPYVGSEKSIITTKKASVGSRRLAIPPGFLAKMEENESSPVCVQDPWLSAKSSPSSNSLLGNVVQ